MIQTAAVSALAGDRNLCSAVTCNVSTDTSRQVTDCDGFIIAWPGLITIITSPLLSWVHLHHTSVITRPGQTYGAGIFANSSIKIY